jgi:hypothetical protein
MQLSRDGGYAKSVTRGAGDHGLVMRLPFDANIMAFCQFSIHIGSLTGVVKKFLRVFGLCGMTKTRVGPLGGVANRKLRHRHFDSCFINYACRQFPSTLYHCGVARV